jgi:hypothetical protein
MLTAEAALKALLFASIPFVLTAIFLLIVLVSQRLASPHTPETREGVREAKPEHGQTAAGVDVVKPSEAEIAPNQKQNYGNQPMGTYEWR